MEQLHKFREQNLINEVTFVLLKKIIELKKEENQWKTYRNFYGYFMVIIIYPGTLFILLKSNTLAQIFFHFVDYLTNPTVWAVLLVLYASHHIWFWFNNKLDGCEDDVDELRKEIIDRAEELWGNHFEWDNRHQVFHYLKKVHDVDLYKSS